MGVDAVQLNLDLAIPGGADGRSTRQATPTGQLGGRQRDSRTVGGSAAGGPIVSWRRDRSLRRFTLNQHSGRLALGFSGFIRMQRDRDAPRGCLIASGALACGDEAEPVRRELARLR